MSENKINLFIGLVGTFVLYKMYSSYKLAKTGQASQFQGERRDVVFGVRG